MFEKDDFDYLYRIYRRTPNERGSLGCQTSKDHLDATRTQLLQKIDTLDDTAFNRKPDAQSWSVAQICHHLVLVEEATRKAIAWGLKAQENSTPARKNVQLILDRTKNPGSIDCRADRTTFTVQAMQDLLATTRKNLLAFYKQSRILKY